MSKFDDIMEVERRQLSPEELLVEIGVEQWQEGDPCPNRELCLRHRLFVSEAAVEGGYQCGYEETGTVWQCHLSGVMREVGDSSE